MRYFFRHLYFCLQSTHLSITIELNNVDSSGLVFFWACSLLGLLDRGADLTQSGDRCRLSQPGWCMQASTAYLPPSLLLLIRNVLEDAPQDSVYFDCRQTRLTG